MKRGRKSILEHGISEQEIKDAYYECDTVVEAALKLGVHRKTLYNYVKKLGLPKKHRVRRQTFSKFIRFLRAHPEVTLPRNVADIAKISHCTKNVVKGYLYRRQNRIFQALNEIDLLKQELVFTDDAGKRIPTRAWKMYSFTIDRFTGDISITAWLKNDQTVMITTKLAEIRKLLNE